MASLRQNIGGAFGSTRRSVGGWTGSDDAMNAQIAAGNRGMDTIRDFYNTGREDLANFDNSALNPYVDSGTQNLGALNRINSGDFSSFQYSPDYQFALDSGVNAIEGSAAGQGSLQSGKSLKDLMRFGQGLGTQNFNNYAGRLQNMAQMGQNAASTQTGQNMRVAGMGANLAQGAGSSIADMHTQIGNAQAAGARAPFNDALSAGGTIAMFSDRRLKTNIKKVGEEKGLNVYEFDYIWGEHATGYMSDEVKELYPEAVFQNNGFDMVDYGALNAA